jgi:hypothetical protein
MFTHLTHMVTNENGANNSFQFPKLVKCHALSIKIKYSHTQLKQAPLDWITLFTAVFTHNTCEWKNPHISYIKEKPNKCTHQKI